MGLGQFSDGFEVNNTAIQQKSKQNMTNSPDFAAHWV